MDILSPPGTKRSTVPIRALKDIGLPTPENAAAIHERRKHLRFPMETELRYQIVRRGPGKLVGGTGPVENISSRGLAFRADRPLQSGMRLRVSMAWPAKLDECKLQLVFEGVVLRADGGLVIVSIKHSEFRTAGKSTPAAREEMSTVAGAIQAAPWPRGSLRVQ
jgi:hypothetical protein